MKGINEERKTLTASLRISLFIGKMCSIRTKGKREERISLSSSMSRSRLFTPLLFTLWAVPLSKFGSMTETENEKSPTKSKFSEKGFFSSLAHFRQHFVYLSTSALKRIINYFYVLISFLFLSFFFFGCFLRLHSQHMEVPRLGIKLELQLLAYTTATATWNPSLICDPYHSSQQC